MVTMNKPAADTPNWYRAITENWVTIEENILDKNIVTAKGDLPVASAARSFSPFPVGTDGDVLMADSTQALGMRWADLNVSGVLAFQSVRATTSTNTSSTTAVDMDSMSLSVTVGATDKVLVLFSANIEGGGNWSGVMVVRDTSGLSVIGPGSSTNPWGFASSILTLDQPGSGTFTYKIQWWCNASTITQDLSPYSTAGDRLLVLIVLPA